MDALHPSKNISPNEVLYERRCANYVYVCPVGLQELISDITREVLRKRPDNICNFIADYLETLMVIRENARVAMKFVQVVADTGLTVSNLLTGSNITKDQAEKAARIIQRAIRTYMFRKKRRDLVLAPRAFKFDEDETLQKIIRRVKATKEQAEHAAIVIQYAYRSYRKRLREAADDEVVDWRSATIRTIDVFKSVKPSREEMQRAATLIKAAYKGYYTRRLIRQLVSKNAEICRFLDYDTDLATLDKAAAIIQRNVRAHFMRKRIAESSHQSSVSAENEAVTNSKILVAQLIEDALSLIKVREDGDNI